MTRRTGQNLVPFAFGALAAMAFSLAGCRPEVEIEAAQQPGRADPPSVYMKDPAFLKAIDERRAVRLELMGVREKLIAELETRVDAKRAEMPGADDAAVKRELEKDPAWNSLVKRVEDANAALDDNRQKTMSVVSARIAPRKEASAK